jgi:FtsP/CotA-like multicopper oxidase with cupredoxin domain
LHQARARRADQSGFPQEPGPPGGEFTYDFIVPDAGTFWYHPHHDSAAQVGYGLYGALVVNDPAVVPVTVPRQLHDIARLATIGAHEQLLDLTIGYGEHQDVSMGINGVHHKHAGRSSPDHGRGVTRVIRRYFRV